MRIKLCARALLLPLTYIRLGTGKAPTRKQPYITALCGVLATSVKTGCRVLTNHMVGICHMLARDPGLLYCRDCCRDGAEDMIG